MTDTEQTIDTGARQPEPVRGRTRARIAVEWVMQRVNVRGAPNAPHLRAPVDSFLPAIAAGLEARPELRAELELLDGGAQLATLQAAVSHALLRPVALVGGCHDYNAKAPHARGNGWGRLLAVARGVESCTGRTAQRAWSSVQAEGHGWRLEENVREEAGWKAPTRKRKAGDELPSSGRVYVARRTRSVSYLSAAFLRATRKAGALASRIADAIRRHIPRSVVLASRLGRALRDYGTQLRRSRIEAAELRRNPRAAAIRAAVIAKNLKRKRLRARAERSPVQGAPGAFSAPPDGRRPSSTALPEPPTPTSQDATGGGMSSERRPVAELLAGWLRPWH